MESLDAREIDRADVEATIAAPELRVPGLPPRTILMRRYTDHLLGQKMLLRVVVEESDTEVIVVTVYRTSRCERYLKGGRA